MNDVEPTEDEIQTHLLTLVEGMDLPSQRIKNRDWRWILRNAWIRNGNHDKISDLMSFCKRRISTEKD